MAECVEAAQTVVDALDDYCCEDGTVGFEQAKKMSAAEIFENDAKTESKFSKGLGAASKLALLL
jgi:hypothetical protein